MNTTVTGENFVLISKTKNRDAVLAQLLPKSFGTICQRGQKIDGFPGSSVQLDGDHILTGSHLGPDRIMLSVYSPVNSRTMKVFSAHVTDSPAQGDPNFYRNWNGCVGLMSWRRGAWEDTIMANDAAPLSLSEVFLIGLFRTEAQLVQ